MITRTILLAADIPGDNVIRSAEAWPGVTTEWADIYARHLRISGDTCIVESIISALCRAGMAVDIEEVVLEPAPRPARKSPGPLRLKGRVG